MDDASEFLEQHANYLILAFGAFAYLLQNFVWFSFPALLPELITDIDLSSTQAGTLNGTIPLLYIFLSIGVGVTIDRFGGRAGIGSAVLLFGTGQLLRGFAWDFVSLFATTVLIGIGAAGVSMGLPKIVADYFPASQSGSMSSGYMLGAHIGSTVAFLLARPFLSPLFGNWRAVFYWSGIAVIAVGVIWFPVVGRLDRLHRDETGSPERESSTVGDGGESEETRPHASLRSDLVLLLSNRDLRLIVVIGTMLLALSHGLRGWLPVILELNGFSAVLAATTVSVLVVGQIMGVLTVPPLSDKFGERRLAILSCGGAALAGTLGILYTPTVGVTIGAVFAVGVGIGGVSPLVRSIPIELDDVGPKLTGTAVGLIFTVGQVGGFLAPFLIGLLEDGYGSFTPGIALLVGCAVALLAAGFLMNEPTDSTRN